jgi:hypothetical protein
MLAKLTFEAENAERLLIVRAVEEQLDKVWYVTSDTSTTLVCHRQIPRRGSGIPAICSES